MKIAGISMTYNDGYKLKEWKEHYMEYKKDLEIFVIVDNGSEKKYLEELKAAFPEAVIIERKENGGCTAAYNDGIKYVLKNTDVEAIAIIANDMKLTKKCLPEMYKYLFSSEDMGIVSTAVLNIESNIIDNYGHTVRKFRVTNDYMGSFIEDIKPQKKETQLVSGGFNMARRAFYENGGLQDEKLFMYCDELDTSYKAKKMGYKIGVIANEYAWHWHINPVGYKGVRHPASKYMISRNRVYIAKKYMNPVNVLSCWIYTGVIVPIWYFIWFLRSRKRSFLRDMQYSFLGGIFGLCGIMKPNKFSYPIKQ